jgi:hypothetical protein
MKKSYDIFKLLNLNPNLKLLPFLKSPEKAKLDPLVAIQQQFGLINMGGKLWVFVRCALNARTDQGNLEKFQPSPLNHGKLLIKRFLRAKYPKADAKKIVEEFWINPKTVCFSGIEFNPKTTSANYLNLWAGYTIVPVQGRWERIKEFLFKIICNCDPKAYIYLLNYIAHALQKPSEKPGVMIILLGGQGIGKGTLGRIFQKIWSATYLQVHNVNSITGNFNASLERTYIVFMDEAIFAGDRRAANALKSVVTEPYILINEKHQPARQIDSYHRFIAATNAEHLKHTEKDDRRDFTLRVSEAHKGDQAYWNALNHEIESGGVAAMAYELLNTNLSDFNVRNKPNTEELIVQKLHSLGPVERWWHDCLLRGGINADDKWPEFVSTDNALEGVMAVAGGRIYRKPTNRDVVQEMKKLCPSAKHGQKTTPPRNRGFFLPSLQQARVEFERYIDGNIDWPEDPWGGTQ